MSKKSRRRRKASQKRSEANQSKSMVTPPENVSNASYGRQEAYLRTSCADNSFKIPEEYEHWNLYFWSHGSCLRSWAEWLHDKLLGKNPQITTDMTPNKTLERKIKERREALGRKGPEFQSVVQQKANNLRGWDERNQSANRAAPSRRASTIANPSGDSGKDCHVL